MRTKFIATLLLALPLCTAAQQKLFTFREFSCRNGSGDWQPAVKTGEKIFRIDGEQIDLAIDKPYRLHIFQTTYLPNSGAIHLCTDADGNRVTVMLVNDQKLFLYAENLRYQISISPLKALPLRAAYADAD
jgi:hypothetical protein